MGLLLSLFAGAIAGWLASKIMNSEGTLVSNIILGVVGSVVGHFLFGLIGFSANGMFADLIVSVIGACVVIVLGRKFSKK